MEKAAAMMVARRGLLVSASVAWLAVVGWLTLRSNPSMAEQVRLTSWHCIVCGTGGTTDVLLNLTLFAPFGILARASGWPIRRLLLAAFALTCCIELTQGTLLVGRDATLGDVLANTVGAGAGWLLWGWIGSLPTAPRRARTTTLLLVVCHALIWTGTAIGLRPALANPRPWTLRALHVGPGQELFQGSLNQATINGTQAGREPLANLPGIGDSLDLSLGVTRSTTTPAGHPASIMQLVDARERPFIQVSQISRGLNVEVPLRASAWRWRIPDWGFPGALEVPAGVPWLFRWQWRGDRIELTSGPASGTTQPRHFERRLSIGLGWAFIHPFLHVVDERAERWTLIWIATWFLLLGWCASLIGPRFGAGLSILALGLFVTAGMVTALPVTMSELAAAAIALLVGGVCSRLTQNGPARRLPNGA